MKLAITKNDLDKSNNNILNQDQLKYLLQATPAEHIYERPAKGGGKWKYVTGTYIKKVLNLMFGWRWSFEVVEYKFDLQIKQAFVLGKLTVRVKKEDAEAYEEFTKMQFGRVDIKFKTTWEGGKKTVTDEPLDLGNDLKAATTDALKKCASELGIASDIYGAEEFREVQIFDDDNEKSMLDVLKKQFKQLDDLDALHEEDRLFLDRIIKEEETKSYGKAIKLTNRYIKKIEDYNKSQK